MAYHEVPSLTRLALEVAILWRQHSTPADIHIGKLGHHFFRLGVGGHKMDGPLRSTGRHGVSFTVCIVCLKTTPVVLIGLVGWDIADFTISVVQGKGATWDNSSG